MRILLPHSPCSQDQEMVSSLLEAKRVPPHPSTVAAPWPLVPLVTQAWCHMSYFTSFFLPKEPHSHSTEPSFPTCSCPRSRPLPPWITMCFLEEKKAHPFSQNQLCEATRTAPICHGLRYIVVSLDINFLFPISIIIWMLSTGFEVPPLRSAHLSLAQTSFFKDGVMTQNLYLRLPCYRMRKSPGALGAVNVITNVEPWAWLQMSSFSMNVSHITLTTTSWSSHRQFFSVLNGSTNCFK